MLEREMATHSSTLSWEIPWTQEPGTLLSMGSKRVIHNWATLLIHLLTDDDQGRREKWWQNIDWRVEQSSISFCFGDMHVRYMQYVYVLCDIYVYPHVCMYVCVYIYTNIYKSSVLELKETLVQLSLHFTHKENEFQGRKWNIQCYTNSFAWSINQEVFFFIN